jgi:hypothetical protein
MEMLGKDDFSFERCWRMSRLFCTTAGKGQVVGDEDPSITVPHSSVEVSILKQICGIKTMLVISPTVVLCRNADVDF